MKFNNILGLSEWTCMHWRGVGPPETPLVVGPFSMLCMFAITILSFVPQFDSMEDARDEFIIVCTISLSSYK